MSLNEGCEWDEDPRLWLCGSCAIIALEAANAENAKFKAALEFYAIEENHDGSWEENHFNDSSGKSLSESVWMPSDMEKDRGTKARQALSAGTATGGNKD